MAAPSPITAGVFLSFVKIIRYLCIMEQIHKPFAITARTTGHPRKLVTPLTIANIRASGREKIVAARINAMWDTGAEVCLISRNLAACLGLDFKPDINAKGLTGDCLAPIGYAYVSIIANGDLVETLTAVVDQTSPSGEYSFIIGLDFIRHGSLAISYSPLDVTLSFVIPSPEPIDFAALADIDSRFKGYIELSSGKEEPFKMLYGAEALDLIIPK